MDVMQAAQAPAGDAAILARARRAGAQFEAVLLNDALGAVERAFTQLPGGKELSTEVYSGLAMESLTTALAENGGIGLGKLIAHALLERAAGHK